MEIPLLVAHRGYASCYPENTLSAVGAALEAGACYIEIDIQMTSDGVPVLLHDDSLLRTAGRIEKINEMTIENLSSIYVGESGRFGNTFCKEPVATLAQLVELLLQWPAVTVFIELKEESLEIFGADMMVDSVMKTIELVKDRVVIISFDDASLRYAQIHYSIPVGWVIREWGEAALQCAQSLSPDYLICNYKKLPDSKKPMWSGNWQWCLYEVTDPILALELAHKGAALIETMAIGEMLQDCELAKRNCLE
ncbi:MAG: glycerophosphodiester phosphodiesterase family protein [Gammaproteobacteria bacterium]|nr:glycerophosphodiester phosphodiesterase family protein [Gammaproteobacteria bacterium]